MNVLTSDFVAIPTHCKRVCGRRLGSKLDLIVRGGFVSNSSRLEIRYRFGRRRRRFGIDLEGERTDKVVVVHPGIESGHELSLNIQTSLVIKSARPAIEALSWNRCGELYLAYTTIAIARVSEEGSLQRLSFLEWIDHCSVPVATRFVLASL